MPEKKVAMTPDEQEVRVDEFALRMFRAMGYAGRLPDTLVDCYNEFKRRKDVLLPGRLSPEGFAMVSMLASMTEGSYNG